MTATRLSGDRACERRVDGVKRTFEDAEPNEVEHALAVAREDAVARELGQPPDQDLVERVAVRRDERVLRARPGEGADLGPRVDGRQPPAPRRVPDLYGSISGTAACAEIKISRRPRRAD